MEGDYKTCPICQNKFFWKKGEGIKRWGNKKYCSQECHIKSLAGITNPNYRGGLPYCVICGIQITRGRTYCVNCVCERFKGNKNPFFGKHHTEETKQIDREKHLGKPSPMKGKHYKEVSRCLICAKELKKRNSKYCNEHRGERYKGKKNPMAGKPSPKGAGRGKGCYYKSIFQGDVWLRSSYEKAYAEYLDSIKEPWVYEFNTFKIGESTYTPDFYLIYRNTYIEIKGYMRKEAQEKIDKFKGLYPKEKLTVLFKKDLINLGIELK